MIYHVITRSIAVSMDYLNRCQKKKIIFFQKKRKCVCALKKCIINLKIAVVPNLSFSQSISVLSKRFSESNHKIMKESKSREGIWDVVVSEILIC